MILRALWLRPTRAHPLRTLATVLGVAVGVASVVSTLLASRAAVASLDRDVELVAGSALLEITGPGGVREEHLAGLRPICDELLIAPVVEGVVLVPDLDERVRLVGIDLLVDVGAAATALGRTDPTTDLGAVRERMLLGNGVAISASLSERLEGRSDLEVIARSVRTPLEVALVHQPTELASAWQWVVLCDVALAQELLGRVGWFDRVELHARAERAPSRQSSRLSVSNFAEEVAERLPSTYTVAPASARRAEGQRLVRSLEFNLTALSGVSVLVAVVLVATSLATSVVQRRHSIAILRSLGASRGQLARAVLLEAAAIGLIGGGAGIAMGIVGARVSLPGVRTTVATVAADSFAGEIVLSPMWVVVGLSLGLASALAASLLPLGETLATPPIQGLARRGQGRATQPRRRAAAIAALLAGAWVLAQLPPPDDRPFWALGSTLLLLATLLVASGALIDLVTRARRLLPWSRAPLLRLAQAAIAASRARAAWATGGVGVAVALAVAMTTMVGSFRHTVVEWTERTLGADLFVHPAETGGGASAGRVARGVVQTARELFGAENVDEFHQTDARVDGQRIELAGATFSVAARHSDLIFLDERLAGEVFQQALDLQGVVVNEPFARRFGVTAGDAVVIDTPSGPLEQRIAGVYQDYSGHLGRAVMDLERYLAIFADEGPLSCSVYLPDDPEPERLEATAARQLLLDALAPDTLVEVLDQSELRAEVLEVFERTFAVTVALQLVASVVAAIAVVAVLSALVQERRRELATLRVLGGSRRQLVAMVLGEASLLGLAGALGGLVVGLGVGYVLVAVVNPQSFGWSLTFAPPWASIGWTVFAVVPACLLAGLVPAWLVLRSAPHEALHEAT